MTFFVRAALLSSLIAAAPSILAVERSGRDSVYAGSNAKPLLLNKKRPANENAAGLVDSSGGQVTTGQTEIIVQPFGRDSVYSAPSSNKPVEPNQVAPAQVAAPAIAIKPAPVIAPPPVIKPKQVTAPVAEPAPATVAPVLVYRTDLENRQWTESLNRIRDGVKIESNHHRNVSGAAAVTVSAFSSGYLIWLLRGGLLLTSLLSTLPAWQTLDPLPILASAKRRRKGEEEEKADVVDRLFDQSSSVDDAPREAMPTAPRTEETLSEAVAPSAAGATPILSPQSR